MLKGLNGHVFTKMIFYARNFRKESWILKLLFPILTRVNKQKGQEACESFRNIDKWINLTVHNYKKF